MSDEEDDYMSDKFLSGLADVRPSLIKSHAKKRAVDVAAKQKDNIKRQKEEQFHRSGKVDNDKLQEALNVPIQADNKGFKLLAKMGYKPGQALGKDTSSTSFGEEKKSIIEPIKISIKADRGGLGRDAALRELASRRRQLRQQHLLQHRNESLSIEDFRLRNQQKAEERFLTGVLRRCQMSCATLDTKHDVENPEIPWFWPKCSQITEAEDNNDQSDNSNPERTKPEQQAISDTDSNDMTPGPDEANEVDDEYSIAEKVELLSTYLRTSYNFCCWCGIHYDGFEDMEQNCPGPTKDDH